MAGEPLDRTALRAAWDRDGFAVVPGLLTTAEAADVLAEVRRAEPLDDGPNPLSVGPMEFRTNLFHRSPALRALLTDPRVVEVVTTVLGPDAWCRWDQAVAKRAGAGWFPWHQDNGYTHREAVHAQLWLALTPSRRENGGLLVVPGGHLDRLAHRWDGGHAVAEPAGLDRAVAVEAHPGDAVVFSSLLPHATGPNVSGQERWAYVAEFLPLAVEDPTVPGPPFVVARDGRPVAQIR